MQIKIKVKVAKWIPFLLLFVLALPILFRAFGSGDELWNYSFAINIAQGRLPYADFNMVQTPLSAYFSALFLLLFGNSLITFRFAGIILISLSFTLLYYICKIITNSTLIACVATCFSYVLVYHIWIYNYNYLILLCVLYIIYKNLQKPSKNTGFSLALVYGVLPLIKQSTGGVLLCVFFAFQFWDIICQKKHPLRSVCEMFFALLPGTAFFVYLVLTNTFFDFWEYAVHGILTFTHRTYLWEYMLSTPIALVVVAFIALSIGLSIYTICKKKQGEERKLHIKILIISFAAGVVAFPLTDHYHMMKAMIPYVVCFLLCIKCREYSISQKRICSLVVVAVMIFLLSNVLWDFCSLKISELNRYEGVPIEENVENNIELVGEFILTEESNGKKVIIADECAVACMIPLDKYTKNFDMLLVGNLGENTVQDLLNNSDGAIYLVTRDETTLGYQAHFELIRFIKENYMKVGEVAGLDAYEKQN